MAGGLYTYGMLEFTLPVIIADTTLLFVRAVLVIVFTYEAWFKLRDIRKFAKNDGLPVLVAYFVAFAELAAALAMFTGVLTQWAGVGIMLLMVITICFHIFKWHSPYWASKKGWEYDFLLFVFAMVVVSFGAGSITLLNLL